MNSDGDVSPLQYQATEHKAFAGFDPLQLYENHRSDASENSPLA